MAGMGPWGDSSLAAEEPRAPIQLRLMDLASKPLRDAIPSNGRFHVRIENVSREALSIRDPRSPRGLHQLSFRFRDVTTGETSQTRWRPMSNYALREWIGHQPKRRGPETLTEIRRLEIPAGKSVDIPINFHEELAEERLWDGLPDPVPEDQFQVVAGWESAELAEPKAAVAGVWAGRVMSEPVELAFQIPPFETPHDALTDRFPAVAIQMMEADPKWIGQFSPSHTLVLHEAARWGNAAAVRWILSRNADVDTLAYNNFTPLHFARDPEIVSLILARKPNLHLRSSINGQTALQSAAEEFVRQEDPDLRRRCRMVLDRYFEAEVECDLFTAISLDDLPRVRAILEKTPELADDFQEESPLRLAARHGRLEICRHLLDAYRVDINDFERGSGFPVILEALDCPAIVRLLIERGADLQTRITWRGGQSGIHLIGSEATLLHYAAEVGTPATVTILLERGQDVLARSGSFAPDDKCKGDTPLEVAAAAGNLENARILLDSAGFQSAPEWERKEVATNSLWKAVSYRWLSFKDRAALVKLLLERGANPRDQHDGITVLQRTVQGEEASGDAERSPTREMARALIEHGAVLDLATAVVLGDEEGVRRLVARDPASANARNAEGRPALVLGVVMNREAIVDILLNAGCDVNIRDREAPGEEPGWTALQWAEFFERPDMTARLQRALAN